MFVQKELQVKFIVATEQRRSSFTNLRKHIRNHIRGYVQRDGKLNTIFQMILHAKRYWSLNISTQALKLCKSRSNIKVLLGCQSLNIMLLLQFTVDSHFPGRRTGNGKRKLHSARSRSSSPWIHFGGVRQKKKKCSHQNQERFIKWNKEFGIILGWSSWFLTKKCWVYIFQNAWNASVWV